MQGFACADGKAFWGVQTRTNAIAWNPMEPMNMTVASEDCNLYTYDMRRLQSALCVHKVRAGHVNGRSLVSCHAKHDSASLGGVSISTEIQVGAMRLCQALACQVDVSGLMWAPWVCLFAFMYMPVLPRRVI